LGISINCTSSIPYCVEETSGQALCSATPPVSCATTATTDFDCTGEGIYPDPESCKKFYNCYNDNGVLKSQLGTCDEQYVFDPDSPSFCRYTNNYYCTLPNCKNVTQLTNSLFIYPFYPYNRQYVALCVPNTKPLVFKCPSNFKPNLAEIPITCVFACKSPGLFPNPTSITKYYECAYNSQRQLVANERSCFIGWTFSVDRCQPPPLTTPIASTAASTTPSSTQSTTGPTTIETTLSTGSTTEETTVSTTEETTVTTDPNTTV
jgi:hypothetical protein